MAAGSSGTNTMSEGLRKVLGSLADLKILPDADIPYILNLEQVIVSKLREPYSDKLMAPGQADPGPPPGLTNGAVPQTAGSPRPPGAQINPDELRRALSVGAG